MGNNTLADASASVSLVSAAVSITAIQPYVSLFASLIGICSGLFALRHYYYKNKERKERADS
jgi:membrane associated rhomboid family serine protease